jgi:hypothetical protein
MDSWGEAKQLEEGCYFVEPGGISHCDTWFALHGLSV